MHKTNRPLGMLLVVGMAFAGWHCGKKNEPVKEPRPVYTMTVGGPAAGTTRSFSGQAKAEKTIDLSFRVGGQISELNFQVGTAVSTGDILARLDPKDAELSLSQAQANLGDAQAKLQNAKAEYERVRKLYEAGSISASELDATLAQYRSAQAGREAAQKQLELAQQQLSYTTLTSSVKGDIIEKSADVFENVSPGQLIGRMVTGAELDVQIGIPESLVYAMKVGMPATVTFGALPGQRFPASVTEVGRAPTELSTYPVKLRLQNPDERIRPGMTGEVTFTFAGTEGQEIALPPQVVVGIGEQRYVWVYDPGTQTVHKQEVEVGNLEASGLVIKSGVKQGDVIVTRGVHRVEEGMKVKPMEDDQYSP